MNKDRGVTTVSYNPDKYSYKPSMLFIIRLRTCTTMQTNRINFNTNIWYVTHTTCYVYVQVRYIV